ncbi:MAG: hypothetical protein QM719_05035 [Thermomonas sp.]
MNWDPFQRDVLAELGHRLYRVRGTDAPAVLDSVERVEPPIPPARTAPVVAPPSRPAPEPLMRALLRAAGAAALPPLDLESLRRDPAGKRALWPRLRALRVQARSR